MVVRVTATRRVQRFARQKLNRQDYSNLQWRAMARAKRDVGRLHVRHIKREIRRAYTRRTGQLLRSPRVIMRQFRDGNGQPTLTVLPNFPLTRYETPRHRGRRDASKQGQWAFVLNAESRFIQFAKFDAERDPELGRIFRKHYLFILRQILGN